MHYFTSVLTRNPVILPTHSSSSYILDANSSLRLDICHSKYWDVIMIPQYTFHIVILYYSHSPQDCLIHHCISGT